MPGRLHQRAKLIHYFPPNGELGCLGRQCIPWYSTSVEGAGPDLAAGADVEGDEVEVAEVRVAVTGADIAAFFSLAESMLKPLISPAVSR